MTLCPDQGAWAPTVLCLLLEKPGERKFVFFPQTRCCGTTSWRSSQSPLGGAGTGQGSLRVPRMHSWPVSSPSPPTALNPKSHRVTQSSLLGAVGARSRPCCRVFDHEAAAEASARCCSGSSRDDVIFSHIQAGPARQNRAQGRQLGAEPLQRISSLGDALCLSSTNCCRLGNSKPSTLQFKYFFFFFFFLPL